MIVPPLAVHGADLTLVLEASTASGTVALLRGGVSVQRIECAMGASRDDALFPAVQALLDAEGVAPKDLSAIVCGSGPGSFTSLRIAAAVAKGLAHATGTPLFAVPSLLLAAAAHDVPGRYVVHGDALRGERYAMKVTIDASDGVRADGGVVRVSADALDVLAGDRQRLVVLGPTTAPGETRVVPDAALLTRVHEWDRHGRVSLDRWEPSYGRLAEAQVKWEATHQRSLPAAG